MDRISLNVCFIESLFSSESSSSELHTPERGHITANDNHKRIMYLHCHLAIFSLIIENEEI